MEEIQEKNQKTLREEKIIPEEYQEPKHKTKYEKLDIPGQIQIGKYKYTFKDQSKADPNLFTYRCQKWECKIPININRENINKINIKNNNENTEYIMKKEHKCKLIDDIKIEKAENCNSEEELTIKAENIIKLNPLKPLSYHINILNEQNIILSKDKINRIITKIRNSNYPQDRDYIQNINLIQITFDQSIDNARNIPFCPIYTKFINPQKKIGRSNTLFLHLYFI